jgi:hypothetical protein
MTFCDYFGFQYHHSQIEELQPIDSPELRKRWNQLIHVDQEKILLLPHNRAEATSLAKLLMIIFFSQFRGQPVTISVPHSHFFSDYYPHHIEATISNFKLRYANPDNLTGEHVGDLPTLAVHIRRGHMLQSDESVRLTPSSQVLLMVEHLNRLFGPLRVTVYSAFPDEELESKLPRGASLNFTADEFEVIHNLVNANYLLIAKSSMSYVAAIMCKGTVFYEPFWHPPLSAWKPISGPATLAE